MNRKHRVVIVNKFRFTVFCCVLTLICATASYMLSAAVGKDVKPAYHGVVNVQYYHPMHFSSRSH